MDNMGEAPPQPTPEKPPTVTDASQKFMTDWSSKLEGHWEKAAANSAMALSWTIASGIVDNPVLSAVTHSAAALYFGLSVGDLGKAAIAHLGEKLQEPKRFDLLPTSDPNYQLVPNNPNYQLVPNKK